MDKKTVSGIMLTSLFISMLTLAFNIQPVEASGTIYIRADGSVEPDTAPISSVDNVTYTFTDNIYDEIVVERDNIVVDGAGYTLQGGTGMGIGIDLSGRSNVTITNMEIKGFLEHIWKGGIYLSQSSNNIIQGNNIVNNDCGISLYSSSNNTISGNNITANTWHGISLHGSSNNTISGNSITESNRIGIWLWHSDYNSITRNNIKNNGNGFYLGKSSNYNIISGNNIANKNNGIDLWGSSDNTISKNNITDNGCGIFLDLSSNNKFYHNNFINNKQQVHIYVHAYMSGYDNFWDDGYPSGGNYWSDYSVRYPLVKDEYQGENQDVLGSDGIWDCPYEIDVDNQDRYPFVEPWSPLPRTMGELKAEIEKCWSEGEIDNQGIVKSLIAKLNVAQKLVDKGKIDEAKSILEEDFIPQVQNLTDIHITPEVADILIKSAEHIISHL